MFQVFNNNVFEILMYFKVISYFKQFKNLKCNYDIIGDLFHFHNEKLPLHMTFDFCIFIQACLFVLSFFPRGVLDEILDLIESVS